MFWCVIPDHIWHLGLTWQSLSMKNPTISPFHSEHHLLLSHGGSWPAGQSCHPLWGCDPRLLCPLIPIRGAGSSCQLRAKALAPLIPGRWWHEGCFAFPARKQTSFPCYLQRERDLSGRGRVRQGQLCTSADTTVCLAMKTSTTVIKLTCLPPFGKHLSFLLLSGLVGGAGLRCRGSGRGGIAAPLTLPDLPVIQKHPHSFFRVLLT